MNTLSRTAAGAVAAALLVSAAPAQGPSQEELRDRFEKKLALEFIETGGWITDYDEARKKANEEGKILFVYFTRSYAP